MQHSRIHEYRHHTYMDTYIKEDVNKKNRECVSHEHVQMAYVTTYITAECLCHA